MFNVITHPTALDELLELPDNLRGRMARLIERLEQEGNKMKIPHSRVIGGGLFELRVGDKISQGHCTLMQRVTKFICCMHL